MVLSNKLTQIAINSGFAFSTKTIINVVVKGSLTKRVNSLTYLTKKEMRNLFMCNLHIFYPYGFI